MTTLGKYSEWWITGTIMRRKVQTEMWLKDYKSWALWQDHAHSSVGTGRFSCYLWGIVSNELGCSQASHFGTSFVKKSRAQVSAQKSSSVSQSSKAKKKCTYCRKKGHTRDECWSLNGPSSSSSSTGDYNGPLIIDLAPRSSEGKYEWIIHHRRGIGMHREQCPLCQIARKQHN